MRYFFQTILILFLTIGLQANTDAASKKGKKAKPKAEKIVSYAKNAEAMALADSIAEKENLDKEWVRAQIGQAKRLPQVIKLMTPLPPSGKKNWAVYRSRFVTPVHINAGVAFWQANQDALLKAEAQYGVPPRIVLGIVGVETIYGRNTGNFRVIDALATLAFDYPSPHPRRDIRMAYFKGELAQFLVQSKKMNREPNSVLGSFAGAMGWPQFMPSSWLKHAVDFDGDGQIDLWKSQADVIGSVANYFKAYGWKNELQATLDKASEPKTVELENGMNESTQYPADDNFFVITKYNNSYYYAAAVLELGAAIEQEIKK